MRVYKVGFFSSLEDSGLPFHFLACKVEGFRGFKEPVTPNPKPLTINSEPWKPASATSDTSLRDKLN